MAVTACSVCDEPVANLTETLTIDENHTMTAIEMDVQHPAVDRDQAN